MQYPKAMQMQVKEKNEWLNKNYKKLINTDVLL